MLAISCQFNFNKPNGLTMKTGENNRVIGINTEMRTYGIGKFVNEDKKQSQS